MLQQALKKIHAELAEAPKDAYVQVVGGFLQKHIQENPEHAALVVAEGKTIAGSLVVMKEEARKKQTNGSSFFTPDEGFAIVMNYYGVQIPEADPHPVVAAAPAISVSLDDLL